MSTDVAFPDGLPDDVLARIRVELGRSGDKVVDALRTAASLIQQARNDESGLRLAESAAYNLREALDAVVGGRPPGDGGFPAVLDAWLRYQITALGPAADEIAARTELFGVLERLADDAERQAFMSRRLLKYIRAQHGVEPIPADNDPIRVYSRLRQKATTILHDRGTLSGVAALYDDSVAWFIRFFTAPDDRVRRIAALASRQYTDVAQIEQLRELAFNSHHIGLFLSEVRDPAWLDPLYDAGLIQPPRPGEPWPITFLVGGSGGIDGALIAGLLDRLQHAAESADPNERQDLARNVIQAASRLGPGGHHLVASIVTRYPADHWVQMIALHAARDADPADVIQYAVADAVIGNERTSGHGYYTRATLELLAAGLTVENAESRVHMMIAKIRRMSASTEMRFLTLDTAALSTPGDDLREPVLILTQHLVTIVPTWRHLGLPSALLLALVKDIHGELGERITCQVLAGATDVERTDKVAHLRRRLASRTATGDDRDLVADLGDLSALEMASLRESFGSPSLPPTPDPDGELELPEDWVRAWRWSLVLPEGVLAGWEEPVAAVTSKHGDPAKNLLDTRIPRFLSDRPRSAYTAEDLNAVSPVEAARLVSAWRPSEDDGWPGHGVWELASTLENVIQDHAADWAEDPSAVVTALREPVYVERYIRALGSKPKEIANRVSQVMRAVDVVRTARWEPTRLSRSSMDPDTMWDSVDRAIVEMIAALANNEADLDADLDLAWELAIELVKDLPEELPGIDSFEDVSTHDDPLNRVINRPYGKALQAILGLAWWEHRRHGQVRAQLTQELDEVLAVPGAVGLELRAILAAHRPLLEEIASEWLNSRADGLFGGELGQITFDQTLKWSRPTPWFYARYWDEMTAAARRGAENATAWPLIGYLWDEPGYTAESIVMAYQGEVTLLKSAAEEMASLVQDLNEDDPMFDRGLGFWDGLLRADRSLVPAGALVGLGRWKFVKGLQLESWFERMDRTVTATDGAIDLPTDVADRCKECQPSERGLRMLRLMLGHGEPWERDHVARTAVEALRAAAGHGVGPEFNRLRDRLLELGRHEAKDIPPEDD